jgi:hypothetical protein
MVRLYHLSLLLAGLAAAAAVATYLPGGKKVTITMRYAAAEDQPGKKIRISVHYADEDRGSDDQLQLDSDDDEPYVSPPLLKRHIDAYELELASLLQRLVELASLNLQLVPHFSFF